jgi:hypothetical protein
LKGNERYYCNHCYQRTARAGRPRFFGGFAFVPSLDLGLSGFGGVLSICFASSSRRRAISSSLY